MEGMRTGLPGSYLSNVLGLLGLVVMAAGQPACSDEIGKVVNETLNVVLAMNAFESKLYTPNVNNYKGCPNTTLTCFANEVKVLLFEIEEYQALHEPRSYTDLPRRLLSMNTEEDNGHCLQCEFQKEETPENFLLALKWVSKLMNSRNIQFQIVTPCESDGLAASN